MKSIWTLFLAATGWKTNVVFPYSDTRKYILLFGPHTSNWDFLYALAHRSILGMHNAHFLAKKELFNTPVGFMFRWMGGIPVDRTNRHNLVDDVVALFRSRDTFVLAMSPEGTRARVERLRSGFYFIAQQAEVPLIPVGLDYRHKRIIFSEPYYCTGSLDDAVKHLLTFYRDIEGKRPDHGLKHL